MREYVKVSRRSAFVPRLLWHIGFTVEERFRCLRGSLEFHIIFKACHYTQHYQTYREDLLGPSPTLGDMLWYFLLVFLQCRQGGCHCWRTCSLPSFLSLSESVLLKLPTPKDINAENELSPQNHILKFNHLIIKIYEKLWLVGNRVGNCATITSRFWVKISSWSPLFAAF